MRKYLIAGNWKMNLNRQQAVELAKALVEKYPSASGTEIVVCPPAVYLDVVGATVSNSGVGLGAQNMYHQPSGAYTGELSAAMLTDVGCHYVILGHSERRSLFNESDQQVHAKTQAALQAGLVPIVCVGESLEQREAGATQDVVRSQCDGSLAGLSESEMAQCVIAYEPVWAIGTGRVATPEQAEEVHADLRKLLENRYNESLSGQVRILYGGSVKPENAAELLAQPNVDGALVGGASLKADDFVSILDAAN